MRRLSKRTTLIIAVITVVLIAIIVTPYAVYSDKLPFFVKAGGIPVGLLGKEKALEKLNKASLEREKSFLEISLDVETTRALFSEIGLAIDSEKTVESINKYYTTNNLVISCLKYARLFYFPKNFSLSVGVDKERFDAYLQKLLKTYAIFPKNANLKIYEDGKYLIEESANGRTIDKNKFIKAVKDSFRENRKKTRITFSVVTPEITDKEAFLAKEDLEKWEKKQVLFYKENIKKELKGNELIGKIEAFNADGKLKLRFSAEKLSKILDETFGKLGTVPVDASFDVKEGQVIIVPGKMGIMPDALKTAAKASKILSKDDSASIEVIFGSREPSITVQKAQKMGVREVIGTFNTTYKPNQFDRVINIKLLAQLLDGELIAPGEIYSFNTRIGPRTLDRGFRLAPTIINGRLVDTVGGGACQVATTLFNTVFFTGLKVLERSNHSFYISNYPPGRDATVSYGGHDLIFKNDMKNWILIKAWASQSSITITFYGTKDGRKVEYQTSPETDFVSFRVEYEDDPTLDLGVEKIKEKGIMGRKITVKRQVIDKNGKVLHDDVFRSLYRPKTEIRLRGTKPVAEPLTSTETTVPAL